MVSERVLFHSATFLVLGTLKVENCFYSATFYGSKTQKVTYIAYPQLFLC